MKGMAIKISFLLLGLASSSVFAEKVVITGQPVVLEEQDNVYTIPAGYNSTNSYNYVTIGGEKRVCYLEKQPSLASLDVMAVNVNLGGNTVTWNCYPANTEYFEITP